MEFTEQQVGDFGVALNEATLVAVLVDAEERRAWLTLAVLALPEGGGPPPLDPRVQIVLNNVGRIAAVLRHGAWDDPEPQIERFELNELSSVVARFNQRPIYGWEFLDVPDDNLVQKWCEPLSLDWRSESGGLDHTLDVFQEFGADDRLGLRFWFDDLHAVGPGGSDIPFDDFTAAGVRWWDALYANDPRTRGHGIVPGGPNIG